MTEESPGTVDNPELLLEGETLEKKMQDHPDGLPWKLACRIFEQCIEALISVRERGIAHRDLTPAIIFVLKNDSVKLLDFDIAGGDSAAAGAGGLPRSYDYMAPEFARLNGFNGDERSDIFSAGVCFYQALTGKLPHKKLGTAADVEYLNRWQNDTEPCLSFQPPVFRVLERSAIDFFRLAIEPERSQRYQGLTRMLHALRRIRNRKVEAGDNTYELEELLGAGGFGEVFRAKRPMSGVNVAVKRLFADQQSRRFIKEAQLLRQLRHEHLVEYVDFADVADAGDSHHYFLVMELLEGMPGWTLRSRIKSSATGMELVECLELFSHYLECLQYLHDHKIIHRDIKPANLYAPAGNPSGAKVFDLGIARDVSGTATSGYVPGTLEYTPPELASEGGDRGSPRSDIYSTGLSLYEAATGKPAYKRLPADERAAFQQFMHRATLHGEIVDYHLPVFTNYPGLAAIIKKAIDIRPKSRYASAAEMRREIESLRTEIRLAAERPTEQRVAAAPVETAATLPSRLSEPDTSVSDSQGKNLTPDHFRRKVIAASIAASAMIIAIAFGVIIMSGILAPAPTPVVRPAVAMKVAEPALVTSTPPQIAIQPAVIVPAAPTNSMPPVVVIAAPTNYAPQQLIPGADELSALAIGIDGETSALLEFFSLSMAEAIAQEHIRAESVSSNIPMTSQSQALRDIKSIRDDMSRLILAATNHMNQLKAGDDLAGLRDWANVAPVLAQIPTVKSALELATTETEASQSIQHWLERRCAVEAAIADLCHTNIEIVLPRLQSEVAAMESEVGSSSERTNQLAYVMVRVSSQIGTIAAGLCKDASKAYAVNNLQDGDMARHKVEKLKNILHDRIGRTDIERLLAVSSLERERTVRKLAETEQSRLAAATRAEQQRAKGARLTLRNLPDNPPVMISYRRSGTERWEELRAQDLPILPAGSYSFRFVRPDYQITEAEMISAPGAEILVVPLPAKWSEKEALTILNNAEKAMSSAPKSFSALDIAFNTPSPAFEWTGHATRFENLRSQWNKQRQIQLAEETRNAEDTVSGYVLWLYQIHDPVAGTYRRYKVPMPPVSFLIAALIDTNELAVDLELNARLKRLRIWETAGTTLQSDEGQKVLAKNLAQCATDLESSSVTQSAKCRFESALLLSKPGEINPSPEKLRGPIDTDRWLAHAKYAPATSTLDSLKHLAAYVEKKGDIDPGDYRMALYSAFYTWRNAVVGEHQYAMEVNTSLGAILNGFDQKSSEAVITFLGTAVLQEHQTAQDGEPCLYMMHALSFMPGLAHGSELKRQATAWIGAHGADQIVVQKEAGIRESVSLLRTLLKVTE